MFATKMRHIAHESFGGYTNDLPTNIFSRKQLNKGSRSTFQTFIHVFNVNNFALLVITNNIFQEAWIQVQVIVLHESIFISIFSNFFNKSFQFIPFTFSLHILTSVYKFSFNILSRSGHRVVSGLGHYFNVAFIVFWGGWGWGLWGCGGVVIIAFKVLKRMRHTVERG